MARRRTVENLTSDELRRLLVERRRADRLSRLERFRRTGRVISVAKQPEAITLEQMRSGPIDEIPSKNRKPARTNRQRWMSGLLLAVEVLAVGGLVYILFAGTNLIRSLNTEVEAVMSEPTMMPTAMITEIVLPSGHTPPNSPQGAQPNYAEIPENLRPLVQTMAELPIPTAGPEHAQHIRIPAIGVDQVIVQGDGWEQLKKGVGQHIGTANPGQKGNLVLSAHDDIYGETFRHLDQLAPGDQVYVSTSQREYIYIVDQVLIVEPTRVDLLASSAEITLTLISCYPYMVDSQRIVVSAHLQLAP